MLTWLFSSYLWHLKSNSACILGPQLSQLEWALDVTVRIIYWGLLGFGDLNRAKNIIQCIIFLWRMGCGIGGVNGWWDQRLSDSVLTPLSYSHMSQWSIPAIASTSEAFRKYKHKRHRAARIYRAGPHLCWDYNFDWESELRDGTLDPSTSLELHIPCVSSINIEGPFYPDPE